MLVATGRAANIEDIGLETTQGRDRPRLRQGRRPHADAEPHLYAIGDVDRRPAARPHGRARGHHRGAHDRRRAGRPRDGLREQPRATYCRPEIASIGLTEQQCEERGTADQDRQGPVPGDRQGAHRRRVRGLRQGHRRRGDRRHARRPHHRPARDRPHRRGQRSAFDARGDAVGDRRARRTRTRRCPRSSARRRWPSTDGRSTSDADGVAHGARRRRTEVHGPMAVTAEQPRRRSVGLTDADLVEMYRLVALARAVDERMWILNRAGRIPFVISGQGHEGAQVGIASALEKGHDWMAPFYRSIATCLTFGMTRARHHDRASTRRASDPSSGGRQMPGHYGVARAQHRLGRSPVATQILHAVGHRAGGQDPQDRPGRDHLHGRGLVEPGRRPRGPQLRGHPQAAVRSSWSRTTATRSACRPRMEVAGRGRRDRAAGYGMPGVIVDGVGRAGLLRGGARGGRPGARAATARR